MTLTKLQSLVTREDHEAALAAKDAEIAALKAEVENYQRMECVVCNNGIVTPQGLKLLKQNTELQQKLGHATKAVHALQEENMELLKQLSTITWVTY